MFRTPDFYDKIQDTISEENNKYVAQTQRIKCDKNRQKPSGEDSTNPHDTKIYLRCRTGKIIKYLLSYELQSLEFNIKRLNDTKENLKSTYLHYITNNKLDSNKLDSNKLDANKLDANKLDANKLDANKLDANKLDANELDADKISKILSQYLSMIESIHNKTEKKDILINIIKFYLSDKIKEIYIYLRDNKLIKLNKNLIEKLNNIITKKIVNFPIKDNELKIIYEIFITIFIFDDNIIQEGTKETEYNNSTVIAIILSFFYNLFFTNNITKHHDNTEYSNQINLFTNFIDKSKEDLNKIQVINASEKVNLFNIDINKICIFIKKDACSSNSNFVYIFKYISDKMKLILHTQKSLKDTQKSLKDTQKKNH
jgi:hypothetical protein